MKDTKEGKTMIYVIDNGESYSNHTLFFVEAPDDFGAWFNEVYRLWVEGAEYRPLMIVGTTNALAWVPRLSFTPMPPGRFDISHEDAPMKEFSTMSVVDFLAKAVEQERNGKPRPRYRLEASK
jgi:hypothetical protein